MAVQTVTITLVKPNYRMAETPESSSTKSLEHTNNITFYTKFCV